MRSKMHCRRGTAPKHLQETRECCSKRDSIKPFWDELSNIAHAVHTSVYIHIYIYIDREITRERDQIGVPTEKPNVSNHKVPGTGFGSRQIVSEIRFLPQDMRTSARKKHTVSRGLACTKTDMEAQQRTHYCPSKKGPHQLLCPSG